MTANNLQDAAQLGESAYPNYPEDYTVFHSRFDVFPDGFYALQDATKLLCGYAIFFPALLGKPLRLNEPLCKLPEQADCFHLHDIVVSEKYRGNKYTSQFLKIIEAQAIFHRKKFISLVAIDGTGDLWSHVNFKPYASAEAEEICRSYSDNSAYMVKELITL